MYRFLLFCCFLLLSFSHLNSASGSSLPLSCSSCVPPQPPQKRCKLSRVLISQLPTAVCQLDSTRPGSFPASFDAPLEAHLLVWSFISRRPCFSELVVGISFVASPPQDPSSLPTSPHHLLRHRRPQHPLRRHLPPPPARSIRSSTQNLLNRDNGRRWRCLDRCAARGRRCRPKWPRQPNSPPPASSPYSAEQQPDPDGHDISPLWRREWHPVADHGLPTSCA